MIARSASDQLPSREHSANAVCVGPVNVLATQRGDAHAL